MNAQISHQVPATRFDLHDEVLTEARMAGANAAERMFHKMSSQRMRDAFKISEEVLRGLVHHGMTVFVDPTNPNPRLVVDQYVQPGMVYTLEEIVETAHRIASFHVPTHFASTGGAREKAARSIAAAVVANLFHKSELVYKD